MSTKPLAIVILAAGQGTRMKSEKPKVMHMLAGRPMIGALLETAESLEPERIIVVVGPEMKELEQAVKPHAAVVQPVRDGTAGAVRAAMPLLEGFKGDVLVLLGDTPLLRAETLQALIDLRHENLLTGLTVLGAAMSNPKGYGRLIMEKDGTLSRIVEDKDATAKERENNRVNIGAFCLDGSRLGSWLRRVENQNAQGEFYITDIPAIAAREGAATRVFLCEDENEVQGCNARADLAKLEATLQQRLRTDAMENGATLIDPASVYFSHDTKIAADVVIEPHVFFGPGVDISAGARIKAFSHIEGAKIGRNVTVGPFARLRPGTAIGEDSRIGNFVEIKQSTIGPRSKINHLAYVGDCSMGEDVNFSAGAITVNYDGFEKHQTHIGKGVMVGSNVNLVAPVTIDDGAFIAAGSTITENVPADSLSIARDSAKIRQGWAAEYRKRKAAMAKKLGKKKK